MSLQYLLTTAMSGVVSREVSPFLQRMRSFLLGRDPVNPLRFQKECAPRPGPEPNLVEGPSHKLSSNYYFTRDARREVELPKTIADHSAPMKALPAEAGKGGAAPAAVAAFPKMGVTPGKKFDFGGQA